MSNVSSFYTQQGRKFLFITWMALILSSFGPLQAQVPKSAQVIEETYAQLSQQRDYQDYTASMDETIAKKLSLFEKWIKRQGGDVKVVDVGTGKGTLAYHLAVNNPAWKVYGVDLSEKMIQMAQKSYQADNLTFHRGNSNCLDIEEATATIYSSVLHEIYSFSGDSLEAVSEAIHVSHQSLDDQGVFLARDWVAPENGNLEVVMIHKKKDIVPGKSFPDFKEQFFRINPAREFPLEVVNETDEEVSYATTLNGAMEFIFRIKDHHWDVELNERYFFWTADQARSILEKNGFTVLGIEKLDNAQKVRQLEENISLFNKKSGERITIPVDKMFIVARKQGSK